MNHLSQFLGSDAGAYCVIAFVAMSFVALIAMAICSPDEQMEKTELYDLADEEDAL